jgi:hypothetical protein
MVCFFVGLRERAFKNEWRKTYHRDTEELSFRREKILGNNDLSLRLCGGFFVIWTLNGAPILSNRRGGQKTKT